MIDKLRAIDNKLLYILIIGLVVRVLLNNIVHSHDAISFVIWAKYISENSIVKLYQELPGRYPPYPPLYYYILWPLGKLMALFGLYKFEWLSLLIVKIPVFAAEIVTTILIFLFTKKYVDKKDAITASAFYFLNPAVILITSVWGQIDSVVTGLVFTGAFLLTKSKFFLAYLVVFLGLVLKLQTFAVFLLFAASGFFRRRVKDYILYLVAFAVIGILILSPLILDGGFRSTFSFLYHLPSQYPYTSVYAYNIFSIFGFMVLDTTKVLGILSFNSIGLLLFAFVSILIIFEYIKNERDDFKKLIFAIFLLFFAFFLFNSRIHSRYLVYTLGFIAPFAMKYQKIAAAMTFFVLLNLILPMTSDILLPFANFLGRIGVRFFIVFLELVTFAVCIRVYKKI